MELFRPGKDSPAKNDEDADSSADEGISTFDPASNNDTYSLDPTNDASKDDSELPLDPALPRGPPATEQNIVPQLLIDHYVSMVDPSRAQTVDSEIARHCAFSLPAVALTLGRYNWPLLRDTYEALATDMQWKVRRTLASSIHELGIILGMETSSRDLIPIFNGFLKDLDEVRQGLLKHLADFMELLEPESRQEYLPKLGEFLKMDNDRNWRFRQELAEQLERLIPLFSAEEVKEHVSPIATNLVRDKVSAVRATITRVLAVMLRFLFASDRPDLATDLLKELTTSLAREPLWVHRQTYASLCQQLRESGAVDEDTFASDLLPDLLQLAKDHVPNVRLVAARTLKSISSEGGYKMEVLEEAERMLIDDPDVDVRHVYTLAEDSGLTVIDRESAALENTGIALEHDEGIGELDSIKVKKRILIFD